MAKKIANFVPHGAEAGVGLALLDDHGRYLFFLAGTRHRCPPGELFYAGVGGHREGGEDWVACAHREAKEEIGTDIDVVAAPFTWYVALNGSVQRLEVADQPRPFALYEMIHPSGTPREGGVYHIVIYKARLRGTPQAMQRDEIRGVIALTEEQVIRGPDRKPTLAELIGQGARIVAGVEAVNRQVRLYPLGTAMALAHVLRHTLIQP